MSQLVVLTNTGNSKEAELIVAILRGNGIPAMVEGGNLQDEWAVSQRLMGNLSIEVKVPESCLEESERILESARATELDDDEALAAEPYDVAGRAEQPAASGGMSWPTIAFVILVGLLALSLALWFFLDRPEKPLWP